MGYDRLQRRVRAPRRQQQRAEGGDRGGNDRTGSEGVAEAAGLGRRTPDAEFQTRNV